VHPAAPSRRESSVSIPAWATAVFFTSAALVGLGYWTYRAVEDSLRELRAESLQSLLGSEVNALRVWIAEETGSVERIARDVRIREAVAELVRRPACAGPARARLEQTIRPVLRESEATFDVVSAEGRLLATRFPDYCGLALTPAFLAELKPALAGAPRFVRPYRDAERVESPPRLRAGAPFAWIAAPVHGGAGEVIAVLAIAQPVDGVFGSILRSARPGENGNAFAYDAAGALLSADRFGDTTTLAKLAGDAKQEGVRLDPYVSHTGVEVIGAWRWLAEHGMGVGLEMRSAEAYAPLSYLNIAFGVVFGALVIAVFAALAAAWKVMRLAREPGRRLGAYRLGKRIGEGGVANVYLAQHDLLKRPTAVKLLKPARATDEMIARFEREVQLASSLSHPNTVEIFDYGRTRDGLFYYAMEYLDGMTVAELLQRQSPLPAAPAPLPVARAVHILRQVCAALTEAHARDIVHRDIKPENIMVCRYGGVYDFVKLLDFGLVKHISEKHSRDLTRTLRILGTPLYMAPERLKNPADVDARADIYAVGAVAFLMLTGRRLFESNDDLALTSQILNDEPPRASRAAPQPIPLELDLIVTSCLEKKRELRPQRVADLVEAFDALSIEHRWTQREAQEWWNREPPAK
jgi:serine/threonine-protein kinase